MGGFVDRRGEKELAEPAVQLTVFGIRAIFRIYC